VRHGMRLLVKAPTFAFAATAVIALGIGAVTAVYSVVYSVMLNPLPYRASDRLVNIWWTSPSADGVQLYPSAADAADWRSASALEDIALARASAANLNLVGAGEPERLQAARVSTNLFTVLGASPALGRPFANDESADGRDHVIILGDGLWRARFGGDPKVVGQTIRLNGEAYTIVGVMPAAFAYPSRDVQAWVPLVIDPRELTREETQNYSVIARLRAGIDVRQARNEIAAIDARLPAATQTTRWRSTLVESMLDSLTRDVRPTLIALLAASSCLLLIACLNLSSLLGGRAAARRSELAVRLALGASRSRLVRQAIAEVIPVLAIGGAAGIVIAIVGVELFVALAPARMPRLESIAVSMPVVVTSLIALVLTGIVAGVAPAMQAWRADFTTMTKDGGRGSTAGRQRTGARRFGVAAQIAVAVPLLVDASLLIRTSMRLASVDLGFVTDGVATFHIAVPRSKYPSDALVAAFYDRLLPTVAAIPGVTHTGMVNRLPLVGNQTMSVEVERAPGEIEPLSAIDSRPATPEYFAALGIPLRAGRTFTDRDDATAPGVAIVDDRLARATWPGQSAIGKRVRRFDQVWCTVVGVVGHIHAISVDVDPRPQIYWSHHQVTQDRMVLVVRGTMRASSLIKPVIDAIHGLDAEQAVYDVRAMDDVVDRSLVQRRLTTALIAAFGAIALVLAAVGLYGVVSYGVTQRGREFGVRLALGASPGDVTRFVVRDGLSMAAVGSVVGLIAALLLGGVMSTLVFGVSSRDVVSLVGATAVVLGVAALASYLPARRAAAIDPALTLRAD
jgi:putative ABC transport system permease protein